MFVEVDLHGEHAELRTNTLSSFLSRSTAAHGCAPLWQLPSSPRYEQDSGRISYARNVQGSELRGPPNAVESFPPEAVVEERQWS